MRLASFMDRCSIEGCDRSVVAQGWCRSHYGRWYRSGTPTPKGTRTLIRRSVFESNQDWLEYHAIPVPESGCWLFEGSTIKRGYGRLASSGQLTAHRASYERFYGPIPDGMCVCHACDVRSCINPNHLFLGTHRDNTQDMWQKGRQYVRPSVTHCVRGHELVRVRWTKQQVCMVCENERRRRKREMRRAAHTTAPLKIALP